MSQEMLALNGVNAASGEYLESPMTTQEIAAVARGETTPAPAEKPKDDTHAEAMQEWLQFLSEDHLGPKEGVDPKKLSEAGWGIIFAHDTEPAVAEALTGLLKHRQEQVGNDEYCRAFTGEDAYQEGEQKWDWLNRHDAGFGPADPDYVPYYLLLVGGPESIPYEFQYQLDVEYAVGRLHFETPEEYAAYAEAVIRTENGERTATPSATFFGVSNPDDLTTQQSADFLVEPLADMVRYQHPNWQVDLVLKDEATKARLAQTLGGNKTPTFLFSASHGVGFPAGSSRQRPHQGAVLCQDWPGPRAWKKAVPHDHYFAGEDVSTDADLGGLVAFHFGCYGAGSTRLDAFAHRHGGEAKVKAEEDFVARLPQRLLGRGALALVAHVEQCWGYSYLGMKGGERLQTFESTLQRLLDGHPVGSAMEYVNRRYAEVSTEMSAKLKGLKYGLKVEDTHLTRLWTAETDARSYVVLGDPAVRLPVITPSDAVTLSGAVTPSGAS